MRKNKPADSAAQQARIKQLEYALQESLNRHLAEVQQHEPLKRQIETLHRERDEQRARANRAENLIMTFVEWYKRGMP